MGSPQNNTTATGPRRAVGRTTFCFAFGGSHDCVPIGPSRSKSKAECGHRETHSSRDRSLFSAHQSSKQKRAIWPKQRRSSITHSILCSHPRAWKRPRELSIGHILSRGYFRQRDAEGRFCYFEDLKIAWDYFVKAAKGGDPVGLTTVAFGYLLPDWTDKMVKQDLSQGRSYLDKALKTDFPRAKFLQGLAVLEGQGFEKNRAEGLRLIDFAYCKNDPSAQKYIKSRHLSAPSCS